MSLSWVQKQILRINPKAIQNTTLFRDVDDEAMSYALEHGYTFAPNRFPPKFLTCPSFVRRCLEMDSENIYYSMSSSLYFSYIPQSMREQVVDAMIKHPDFLLSGHVANELARDPNLWLKSFFARPENRFSQFPVRELDIPELEKGRFYSELVSRGAKFEDFGSLDAENVELLQYYLEHDTIETYASLGAHTYRLDEKIPLVKAHIFSNLDKNVRYIRDFKLVLGRSEKSFTEEEKEKIVEAAKRQNYILQADDYDFLTHNADLMYQTIMAMEGEFSPEIEQFLKRNESFMEYDWTPEQQADIGRKLAQLHYGFGEKSSKFLITDRILEGIIDVNPYYLNRVVGKYYVDDGLRQRIDQSGYVITRDTPSFVPDRSSEWVLAALERNFEEVSQNPTIYVSNTDAEFERRVYEICKENGYILAPDAAPYLSSNQYLIRDAFRAGIIPNAEDKLRNMNSITVTAKEIADILRTDTSIRRFLLPHRIQEELRGRSYRTKVPERRSKFIITDPSERFVSDEKIVESLSNYFPSILNISKTYLSREMKQEIARLYFEYMDSHPNENPAFWEKRSKILAENPYIYMEQARRGEPIVFWDGTHELTDEMYEELSKLNVEKKPRVPRPERILTIGKNLSQGKTPEELAAVLTEAGVEKFLQEDDPESLRSNPILVMAAINQDINVLDYVSPIIQLTQEQKDAIVEKAIQNNYEMKESSLSFLSAHREFAMYKARTNPAELEFFASNIQFSQGEQEEILNALLNSETPIVLNDGTFYFLRGNEAYIRYSIEHSTPENIQSIIDNVNYQNLPDTYRDEFFEFIAEKIESGEYVYTSDSPRDLLTDSRTFMPILERDITVITELEWDIDGLPLDIQRDIYEYYEEQIGEGEASPELEAVMQKNTYYMEDYIENNIDKIDEAQCNGVFLHPEFKAKIAKKLLETGYRVTANTPRYILTNRDFIAGYVLQDPARIEEVGLDRVLSLITRENFKNSSEVRALLDILPEGVKTPIDIYVEYWGKDKAYELLGNFGDAVKYLNSEIDYSLESATDELVGLFKRGAISNENDAISLISNLGIELTEEDFKALGRLSASSRLFEKLLPDHPEYIKFYTGIDNRVFEQALALGMFDGKTDEEISELLTANVAENSAVMSYLLENGQTKQIVKYKGRDKKILERALELGAFDELSNEEINKFLNISPIAQESKELMLLLIEEKSPEYILRYSGESQEVFLKAIEKGAFADKEPEELERMLTSSRISSQADVMRYVIENYSPEYIEKYSGKNEEVYKRALELGYTLDIEKLKTHDNLLNSDVMFGLAASQNPQCYALKFATMSKEDIEKALDKIYAGSDFLTPQKKEVFAKLCSILSGEKDAGLDLLRAFNPELVDTIGLENWRTLLRYSVRQPNLKDLVQIAEDHKMQEFLTAYKAMSPMIMDDVALGINKFLNIASFYKIQPEFCTDLVKSLEEGKQLTDVEKVNLQILIYNARNYTEEKLDFANLENLIQTDKQKYLDGLETGSPVGIKSDLMQYLFNMDIGTAEGLLSRDINSKIVAQILSGARKTKNQSLQLEAEYMSVLVDTLEQIYYFDGEEADLKDFARRIYSADEKEIFKIRKEFANIRETVRRFYERDSQEELTDIRALAQDEKYYTFYDYKTEDGEPSQIKVIDVSQMKHTVYAHALGTTVGEFFEKDSGRPTICVSPETDMHEAFYGGEHGVILIFSEIPNGSFIGSAPANMGSNGSIQYNDYNVDGVRTSLRQMGIRQSHVEEGHAETLLYRAGLMPVGIKMVGDVPSQEEINAAREFEKKIFELTGKQVEIPIVKTQHEKNRVVRYQGNITEEKELAEYEERAKKVQELRREFLGILDLETPETPQIRNGYDGEKYTIIDGEVYTVQPEKGSMEQASAKVAMNLEKLIHGPEFEDGIDVVELEGKEGERLLASKVILARDLWHYNREDGGFTPRTNSVLLNEFLVDHLMCNYSSDNRSFALDVDNQIYPVSKQGAFKTKDEFISRDGRFYTGMSYLYFNGEHGNNLYRRSFENYIANPNESEIFTDEQLQGFVEQAEAITQMDEAEYLELFKPMLDSIKESAEQEQVLQMILARKQNAGRDAAQFVDRIKTLRRAEQEPEIVEDASSIAFVNDIHGNLAAVQSIIEDCKATGKKTIYILGDMIGFGPQSNECLDAIRQASKDIEIRCILGNHELYSLMGNQNFTRSFGFESDLTSRTRSELSPENREFLEGLPISRRLVIEGKKVELTHFPIKPKYEIDSEMYLDHGAAITDSRSGAGQDYLIYGHEHRTEYTTGNDVGTVAEAEREDGGKKTIFLNLPSSGCVHGKNTSYVTLELRGDKFEPTVKPVEYDQEKTKEAVKATHNPKGHFFGVGGVDGR